VLHNFIGVKGDGAYPASSLIFDNLGNLYGTTSVDGINGGGCGGLGCGTAFELTPSGDGKWKERVLHAFTGGVDGGLPSAGFILDSAGNLYSTTSSGGHRCPRHRVRDQAIALHLAFWCPDRREGTYQQTLTP
jgi:hypothetical protein